MAPRVEDPRHRAGRRRPAAARAYPARPPDPAPSRAHPASGLAHRTAEVAPIRDRGLTVLAVFTGAMLVMVGLAVLTAVVGHWWILVPVMAIDLTVTAAVLASVARLLNDGDGR